MNEVPQDLVDLYRHWQQIDCSEKGPPNNSSTLINQDRMEEAIGFTYERMLAWKNRSAGISPTSQDRTIAKFKFCNIYRELDRQTIFFHKRLKLIEDDFEKWLMNMFASRFIANISTVESLGMLKVGREDRAALEVLKAMPSPKYGNAYVFPISTIKSSAWPSREEFLCLYVPTVIAKVAKVILSQKKGSVNELLNLILPIFGFNQKFLWTEVLIDVHYQFPELVDLNRDFYIGPGAKPSLSYLMSGLAGVSEQEVLAELAQRYSYIEGVNLSKNGKPILLTAENWEGICCEFRKYRNLKKGVGRRRIYGRS
jgi:hypothetical protein